MSSLVCAAIQDLLERTIGIKVQDDTAVQFDGVAEPRATYGAESDYDDEHRCAEHEYEHVWECFAVAQQLGTTVLHLADPINPPTGAGLDRIFILPSGE